MSLLPAFKNEPLKRVNPIFWEHEGNRAIRDGKWKAVSRHKEPWQLYDMEADRTETTDLIDKYPEKAKELIAAWEAYAKRAYVEEWPGKKRTEWGGKIDETSY